MPKLINQTGVPACGLYTRLDQQGPTKFTYLSFGLAVAPIGTSREGRIAYQMEGEQSQHSATFKDDAIREGRHTTVDGAPTKYLAADIGILSVDGVATAKVAAFLTGARNITVTVDPQNRISETNEQNNVLTLRVTPPGKKAAVAIKDNRCAAL